MISITETSEKSKRDGAAAGDRGARQRLSAGERREQILAVTRRVADAEGFHAISLERIAREAGISRPIVYQHFGDLDGLLTALVESEGEAALAQLAEILPAGPLGENPVAELVEALRGYLEAVAAEPARWRLVLMPPEGTPAVLRERIAEGRGAVVAQIAEFAAPVLQPDDDGARSPDIGMTALTMSMLSDDAARLLLTEPESYPIERIVRHARWLLERIAGP